MTCCKSPSFDLDCVIRYSSASTGSEPQTASIGCSSGYEMVGCSGWGKYKDISGYFISNDVCYAKGADNDVYATALWYVCFLFGDRTFVLFQRFKNK